MTALMWQGLVRWWLPVTRSFCLTAAGQLRSFSTTAIPGPLPPDLPVRGAADRQLHAYKRHIPGTTSALSDVQDADDRKRRSGIDSKLKSERSFCQFLYSGAIQLSLQESILYFTWKY